jgi:hypothetical protein
MSSPTEPAPEEESATDLANQHPVLLYTTWRIAIFVVTLIVLYFVGLRDVWLLVLAFLVSGVISIFVLDRRRQQAVGGFTSLFSKMNDRIDASARAEDDDYVGGAVTESLTKNDEPGAE